MDADFLDNRISPEDARVSAGSVDEFRRLLTGMDRSLVFFVGAGASSAGNTGLPLTPDLIGQLLGNALARAGAFDLHSDHTLRTALTSSAWRLGFEITLNDLWQIGRKATTLFFECLAKLDENCVPNRVHKFLAHWLLTRGTVLTTNYDRLIEHSLAGRSHILPVRYGELGPNSFEMWQDELARGGCLFKLHGTLDDPESCLGALEHVGTRLVGSRASLLAAVMSNRPLCFVGWRGVDPDIPPLLAELACTRSPDIPTFWLHYEGLPPGSKSIESGVNGVAVQVRRLAGERPILTDADRAFGVISSWSGAPTSRNPDRRPLEPDFSDAVALCSPSGAARFVGIALRRAGEFEAALKVLETARDIKATVAEHSAAVQEIALLRWAHSTGPERTEARSLVQRALTELRSSSDPHLKLNADFGLVSMTVLAAKSRPWLLLKLPGLFHRYKLHIEELKRTSIDKETVALHESLLNLYVGRLRLALFGSFASFLKPAARWVLRPFDIARSKIDDVKDIHLHSRVDVLSYRTLAMARCHRCEEASKDLPEIDRLIGILADGARSEHWNQQRRELERVCIRHHVG